MATKTLTELKQEQLRHLQAAKAICDLAEKDGRDFTAAERTELADHMDAAERVKAAMKDPALERERQKQDDQALRDLVAEMGRGIDPGYSSYGRGAAPGPWAKAFNQSRQLAGAKDLISPSGSIGVPSPTSVLAPLGDTVETMLQLIPQETIGSDAFTYLRETVRDHAAAPVAAKGIKPTSTYSVERIDDRVRTIAHLSEPVPRSYLADAPLLGRYLDTVLREGLRLALEAEVIAGDGTGEHLEGLFGVAGTLEQLFDSDILTTTRKAVTLLELQSIAGDAWVIHPSDWETFELYSDLEGQFKLGPGQGQAAIPIDRAKRRLWGLPVALSVGMTQGYAILADFAGSTRLYTREQVRVDWSENVYDAQVGANDFERNLVRYRAEGRWGFAVTRPTGIVVVDLVIGS
jgi:HK97 family phage major capsid protein